MPTLLLSSAVFVRKHKSLFIVGFLLASVIGLVWWIRSMDEVKVDWAKQIEQLELNNRETLKSIEDAHAREKAELESRSRELERRLKSSEEQYDREKATIVKRRSDVQKEIVDRSGGDPTIVARELAKLFGFQMMERAKEK